MASPTARPFASRLRSVIAFVAIVWGIATTFVAFEMVSLSGMDLVLSDPAVFGNVALSRTATRSTSCSVKPGETPEGRTAGASPGDARVGAWFLGVSLGRDAVLRQYAGLNVQALDQIDAGRRGVAGHLDVPAPAVFHPAQIATANTEFVAFIEQDASGTAHRLALNFSPQTCELFKLGALWGLLGDGPPGAAWRTRGLRDGDPPPRAACGAAPGTLGSDAAAHSGRMRSQRMSSRR